MLKFRSPNRDIASTLHWASFANITQDTSDCLWWVSGSQMKPCLILLPYKKAEKHQQPDSNHPTKFQWPPIQGNVVLFFHTQCQSVSSKWAFIQPAVLFVVWVQKGLLFITSHTYVQIQHQDALQGFGGDSFSQSAAFAAPVMFLAWPEFSHSCACALLFPDYCPYRWNWV